MPCLELGTCVDTTQLTKEFFKDTMPCPPSISCLPCIISTTDRQTYVFPDPTAESLFQQ